MTPDEFRAWMDHMGCERRSDAANILGVSVRTIDAWLRQSSPTPIPRPITKLCKLYEEAYPND